MGGIEGDELILMLIALSEILLFLIAGVVLWRPAHSSLSGAFCYTIMTLLVGLSGLFQFAFLIHWPRLAVILELILTILAVFTIWQRRSAIWRTVPKFVQSMRQYPWAVLCATLACGYMLLQVILLPPGNNDSMSYNLARVLLFQQEGTLLLTRVNEYNQAIQPVGSDILAYLFLRWHTDVGVALFSFLAYLAIGFGTYALAQQWTIRSVALTATIVSLSLPELVYQATSTKNDIITAATAIVCLVAARRLWKCPNAADLLLLGLALCFGVSAKTTFAGFAIPFALLVTMLLLYRHGIDAWRKIVMNHRLLFTSALLPAMVLSQLWLFVHNKLTWGTWFGPAEFVSSHRNPDGLLGAVANGTRYLLQSIDLLRPIDPLFRKVNGYQFSETVEQLYQHLFAPLWGNAGAPHYAFDINWLPHEDIAWYGPLGFLLVLPAVVYTLWRAPLLLKVMAVTLVGYALLVAWQVAWMPWNNRFFSLFFAGSGVCVAFLLQRWSKLPGLLPVVRMVAVLILFYAVVFNRQKPLITNFYTNWWESITEQSVWVQSDWGRNRLYYANQQFGDDRVQTFIQTVPPAARVGLLTSRSWVYPFLLNRPDVTFILLRPDELSSGTAQGAILTELEYLLCLEYDCQAVADDGYGVITWQAAAQADIRTGMLLQMTGQPALAQP